ncbi:MAG: gamma-glutamyltransferase family protein [Acidimicrobiia bacterium]
MPLLTPFSTVRAPGAMICSADQLATQAGMAILAAGGNAVDAAIATNAAIAVTCPHLCGMGGDLFALVHGPDAGPPTVLNASGRAGSGVSSEELRAEGRVDMPFRHDPRAVTVPGCVDGWTSLHDRYGSLDLATILAPAIRLAEDGFPASPLLVGSLAGLDARARDSFSELLGQARAPGAPTRRPGAGRTLRTIAATGRAGFYEGEFGEGLLALGNGVFSADDLARTQADWVAPLGIDAWGHRVWTIPPGSQGYLTLAGAAIAAGLPLPEDTDDPSWAHLLIEAAIEAGYDRPAVLHEGASGAALLDPERLAARRARIDPERTQRRPIRSYQDGDTTYLCVVDRNRMGVSLIQSNASGFGSWLVEPGTGINLHNRGLGFSVEAGHPAEIAPGRRPPHTLSPALVTRLDGSLAATIGTMGGDGQPQILLQLLARLLASGQSPAAVIGAGRWVLRGPVTGFDTWTAPSGAVVQVEGNAPATWVDALHARGHQAERTPPFDSAFGHAHVITVEPSGLLAGAADPRARIGAAAGL